MTTIAIANRQTLLPIDKGAIRRAVRAILADEVPGKATISVAVVDDAAISDLNERFLGHQGPTDVLSFVLEQGEDFLDGEVVVSAETACRAAAEFGWSPREELLLYVIHGALHLAGYDDATPGERAAMRSQETKHLALLGIRARHNASPPLPPGEGRGEGEPR